MTMITADKAKRGRRVTIGKSKVNASKIAAAFTKTESGVRAPKARFTRLGPILIPAVIPPKLAATPLPMPRRSKRWSACAVASPGCVTSFAHSSASMEAMMARANPPPRMVGQRAKSSPMRVNSPIFPHGASLSVSLVASPIIGPRYSRNPRPMSA